VKRRENNVKMRKKERGEKGQREGCGSLQLPEGGCCSEQVIAARVIAFRCTSSLNLHLWILSNLSGSLTSHSRTSQYRFCWLVRRGTRQSLLIVPTSTSGVSLSVRAFCVHV